jgi:Tfp pilus assembly protein PilO
MKLSSAKRNQLVIVALVTLAALSAIYFFLISPQNQDNKKLTRQITDKRAELDKMRGLIKTTVTVSNQLAAVSGQLHLAETDIASGDAYAWTYDVLRRFKSTYAVDIPSIGQPSISDVDLLPNFPYKQLRVSLTGVAYYQDLGKFVADFENDFPHMRVVNLTISPVDQNGDSEKLSFHMDVIALAKPSS